MSPHLRTHRLKAIATRRQQDERALRRLDAAVFVVYEQGFHASYRVVVHERTDGPKLWEASLSMDRLRRGEALPREEWCSHRLTPKARAKLLEMVGPRVLGVIRSMRDGLRPPMRRDDVGASWWA